MVGVDDVSSVAISVCPATCQTPEAPANCTAGVIEACMCEPGLILKDEVCVDPGQCGCVGPQGTEISVSISYYTLNFGLGYYDMD